MRPHPQHHIGVAVHDEYSNVVSMGEEDHKIMLGIKLPLAVVLPMCIRDSILLFVTATPIGTVESEEKRARRYKLWSCPCHFSTH